MFGEIRKGGEEHTHTHTHDIMAGNKLLHFLHAKELSHGCLVVFV